MLNGKKLSRDGKANFLISGDAFLPTNWWNRLEKGTGPARLCHLPEFATKPIPRPTSKYPTNPFLQSRTLETSHLPLGRSSRLALIQLKTPDDRAKQQRIDHENFN